MRREAAEEVRHEPSIDRGVVRGGLRRLGQCGGIDRLRAAPSQLVQRTRAGDGEQPGGERAAPRVVLETPPPHLGEHLLEDVLGAVVVAQDVAQIGEQGCAAARVDLLERTFVIADEPGGEAAVGRAGCPAG